MPEEPKEWTAKRKLWEFPNLVNGKIKAFFTCPFAGMCPNAGHKIDCPHEVTPNVAVHCDLALGFAEEKNKQETVPVETSNDSKQELWDCVCDFLREHQITVPEEIVERPDVMSALPDLVEDMCDIIGFSQTLEEKEEDDALHGTSEPGEGEQDPGTSGGTD